MSVPTDCPQRDERLGWTGDAQAFVATGSTLLDAEAFWRSWLRDLALEQDPVLGVPSVVPDVVLEGPLRFGRAGWGDAAAIVPWAVYEAYGDPGVIADQWVSMRSWVESLVARRGDDGLLGPSPQFGDWLDPDAPAEQAVGGQGRFRPPCQRLLRGERPADRGGGPTARVTRNRAPATTRWPRRSRT